jgi:hypothetical protein
MTPEEELEASMEEVRGKIAAQGGKVRSLKDQMKASKKAKVREWPFLLFFLFWTAFGRQCNTGTGSGSQLLRSRRSVVACLAHLNYVFLIWLGSHVR